jgi:hypothetical protein
MLCLREIPATCNPATWEAKIGRFAVQGQPRQIVCETPSPKEPEQKWAGGVAQAVELLLCKSEVPDFKPQSH